MAWC